MDSAAAPAADAAAPSTICESGPRSEMRIEPNVVEGRQRIVIKHFSLLKNDVTEAFDSPQRFTLCGEEFNLRLYPGGFNEESRNYLGFYLKSHGKLPLWLAKSDFRIVNQKARPAQLSAAAAGGEAEASTLPDEVKAYDSPAQLAPGKLYGYSMFLRRDKLLNEVRTAMPLSAGPVLPVTLRVLQENGLCVNDVVIFETALTCAATQKQKPSSLAPFPKLRSDDFVFAQRHLFVADDHRGGGEGQRCACDRRAAPLLRTRHGGPACGRRHPRRHHRQDSQAGATGPRGERGC